jgi:hypothetical protein
VTAQNNSSQGRYLTVSPGATRVRSTQDDRRAEVRTASETSGRPRRWRDEYQTERDTVPWTRRAPRARVSAARATIRSMISAADGMSSIRSTPSPVQTTRELKLFAAVASHAFSCACWSAAGSSSRPFQRAEKALRSARPG